MLLINRSYFVGLNRAFLGLMTSLGSQIDGDSEVLYGLSRSNDTTSWYPTMISHHSKGGMTIEIWPRWLTVGQFGPNGQQIGKYSRHHISNCVS